MFSLAKGSFSQQFAAVVCLKFIGEVFGLELDESCVFLSICVKFVFCKPDHRVWIYLGIFFAFTGDLDLDLPSSSY